MRKLFTDTNIDFIGKRNLAYVITAVVFGLGLLLTLWRGFNYSVEFTGGTFLQVTTQAPADFAAVREALAAEGIHGADIQRFGTENELVIRARSGKEGVDADNTTETVQAVAAALNTSIGQGQYVIEHSAAVSPKVGGEMRDRAFVAIMFSFVLVLLYLAYRFEWRLTTFSGR
jgi:preprotein translocase subunit SecF